MIPEDQEIPFGGVSFCGPREEIFQDLGISGVRLAEALQAVPLIATALRDQETPGLPVSSQAVKVNQAIDVLCGAHTGHFFDVPERRPIEVVVPGHVDHDRPFGLVAALNFCLVRHRAPFHPAITGSKFRGDGKGYWWEESKKVGAYRRYRQKTCLWMDKIKVIWSNNVGRLDFLPTLLHRAFP